MRLQELPGYFMALVAYLNLHGLCLLRCFLILLRFVIDSELCCIGVKLPLPFIPLATHAFIGLIAQGRKGLVGFQASKLPEAVHEMMQDSKRYILCSSIVVREVLAYTWMFKPACCLQQQLGPGFIALICSMLYLEVIQEGAQLAFQR